MSRPPLNKNISPDDFQNHYWLKEELISFCKEYGISCSGGKIGIAGRIELFLKTGVKRAQNKRKNKIKSNFDWNTEQLSLSTIITDNYKNTQNVRNFFTCQIGKQFSFNVRFMDRMRENTGKNLGDAVEEWNKINNEKKDKSVQTVIAPQFEYNAYIRDFLADNPDKTLKDAIHFWKLKRDKKGTNKYKRSDLYLIS